MSAFPTCPTDADLQGYVRGLLLPGQAAQLEYHIDTCSACLARIAARPGRGFILEALSRPAETDQQPSPALLARLEGLYMSDTMGGEAAHGSTACDTPDADHELEWVAHYRVLHRLGSGGMGVVYCAEDTQLHRLVALKLLSPRAARGPRARDRFLREARSAAALNHDHIVTIFQVGEAPGANGDGPVPYLAMELLEGEGLDRWMARHPRPPLATVLHIARGAAAGLTVAHEHGLVHRDVKAANLWLAARGTGSTRPERLPAPLPPNVRVKLLDFGLAAVPDDATGTGRMVGTPAYMAPEVALGAPADARADLFGLGCVLYELCTGSHPFPNRTRRNLAYTPPVPVRQLNPMLPPALSELVTRMLAEAQDDRPKSVAEIEPILAALEPAPNGPARRKPRVRVWAAAGGAGATAVLLTTWTVLAGPLASRPAPATPVVPDESAPATPVVPDESGLVEAVIEQLKKANPGFKGTADIGMEHGKVVSISFSTNTVADIRPVRALHNLKMIRAVGSAKDEGRLTDLSPLRGLPLERIECWHNPGIRDFAPLRGMKFTHLDVDGAALETLDDLVGMPLLFLAIDRTRVRDLSPLRTMPQLTIIHFAGCHVTSYDPLLAVPLSKVICDVRPGECEAVLRRHPTLKFINGKPTDYFWAKYNPKDAAGPPN